MKKKNEMEVFLFGMRIFLRFKHAEENKNSIHLLDGVINVQKSQTDKSSAYGHMVANVVYSIVLYETV
jgi:hypothetical protein